MPRFGDEDRNDVEMMGAYLQKRLQDLGLEPRSEPADPPTGTIPERVATWFEQNPEAHQCMRINPFTGEPVGDIYERLEIEGADRHGPAELSLAFLNYLATEMKYNPEWREHHS